MTCSKTAVIDFSTIYRIKMGENDLFLKVTQDERSTSLGHY